MRAEIPPPPVTPAQYRAMRIRSALVLVIWLFEIGLLLFWRWSFGLAVPLGLVALCITLYDAPLMRRLAKEKLMYPNGRQQ
ncbi:hypothetical protein PFX98_08400 [Paucibacter sediminis]|uniref:Uncharacterized protein n=1 Tax=Paucibacter sediminis TaxID=3019553 RepID=A0AA95SYG2_9BURK|nr:hypothetical protein [Paucibacter sp. S2-9]WIT13624.1 hypothetical protein PFX98_08400 [Paucibacter sp. S2-9]